MKKNKININFYLNLNLKLNCKIQFLKYYEL